eukprot:5711803-Pyramimonas_sp.AAC.2
MCCLLAVYVLFIAPLAAPRTARRVSSKLTTATRLYVSLHLISTGDQQSDVDAGAIAMNSSIRFRAPAGKVAMG